MNAILVTGAAGYVGSVLIPELLDHGHTVVAADTFPHGPTLDPHPGLRIETGDVRSISADLLAGVDTVVALAAVSNDPAGHLNPAWTTAINRSSTHRLALLAQAQGVRRFVHASTAAVYGSGDTVLHEESPVAPRSEYARSKLAAEADLAELATDGFTPISLRLGTLYGISPRMRIDLAVHAMVYRALSRGQVRVDGDGTQWRPMLHVRDAAAAYLRCIEAPDSAFPATPIWNVVGENIRIRSLARTVAGEIDPLISVEYTRGLGDTRNYRLDGTAFTDATGFTATHTVPAGVREVRDWFRDDPTRMDAAATDAAFSTEASMRRQLVVPAADGGRPIRDTPLPFALPLFGREEENEIVETLRSGWLSTGPRTKQFEAMVAEYVGARHAVATNSCTSALHTALVAAGIGPGDEVITSPITWPATGNAIIHTGATPVFADIDPATLMVTPDTIRKVITSRTQVIMPVHIGGQPADIAAIGALADEHGLMVIEDAAHALGAEQDGRRIGRWSPMTCFSFYATKNVSCGEGGMLVTDNDEIAETARMLVSHGISRDAWKRHSVNGSPHWHQYLAGFKYNMPDLAAALGIHQLPKLDGFIDTRAAYAALYDELLAEIPGVAPIHRRTGVRHAHHLYIITLDLEQLSIDRDKFAAALREEGIATGIHFMSLTRQPYYHREHAMTAETAPAAAEASDRILSLPLYPAMTEADIDDVAAAVRKIAHAYQR
ncbi:bifunctional SDR family oxidoreductase/aminotransferase class I/II-fold pyridoxal phosphate-dependent enzyme [Nocardia carnea]|uniref:bifunctional SDR family oxidoreductase/aminotransferase class I/II-fold pyridoxal phosphate-dependent enzyme n=1 Tax=Nocardia carnea TaxID=37328 RepID=UPI002454AF82|nr:bifunctional SDR family oxidoreductase/aminotransferase class I/II-fold pyridoxal phosphate-dependent enzyme [Nocardia carnea]